MNDLHTPIKISTLVLIHFTYIDVVTSSRQFFVDTVGADYRKVLGKKIT